VNRTADDPNTAGHTERFDHYMERCLYGPSGFYATVGSAGRRGDFITSPEVGPLFGTVLSRAITRWWIDAGRPEPFTVVDAGCGPGTLLRAVKKAVEADGDTRRWRFVGVDRAPDDETKAALAGTGIELDVDMPDDLSGSVVIGNEILDNMAIRILVTGPHPELHHEVFVTTESGEASTVTELLRPIDGADPPTLTTLAGIEAGSRVPIHHRAAHWVARVLAAKPIALCLFDYGAPTTAELVRRGGWLRTYRRHERGEDPYREPGRWDITTDVGFDQLPVPTWLGRQGRFLTGWGLAELVEEGRRYWSEHAHAPDLTAVLMRSRLTEAPALTEPDGLGNWMTALWLDEVVTTAVPAVGESPDLLGGRP